MVIVIFYEVPVCSKTYTVQGYIRVTYFNKAHQRVYDRWHIYYHTQQSVSSHTSQSGLLSAHVLEENHDIFMAVFKITNNPQLILPRFKYM